MSTETYDVVVIGSGAAGAMAALRAADRGLSVLIVEKAHKFGGTSATSGGVLWVPNHQLTPNDDNRDKTLAYLDSILGSGVNRERLDAYLDNAPEMAKFIKSLGIPLAVAAWPDYYATAPSARTDRSLICDTFDGRELGEHFPLMREQYNRFKVLGRYSMDVMEFFSISTRSKGWVRTFLKMGWRYWTDRSTRRITARDRRFTMGAALMGWLYKHVLARRIEIRLDTKLDELVVAHGQVTGVKVNHFGRVYEIGAKHGVVLAAGGFEWNQELRDRFFPVPGLTRHSSSPEDANRGEALIAGMKIGAATEHTESGWWIPTMHLPMASASNFEEIHQAAFDVGRPHSVCVNRNGVRFVDEATGYDEFGKAMVADQLKTGANTPCWLVFDATFREKFTAGGIMPTILMADRKIPPDWWDHYIFRADTLDALAKKIQVPAEALERTVASMNGYAKNGVDPEFGRGGNSYDQMFGDFNVKPNPCLGPIDRAPYYAVAINLGDLGTKGGLKADAQARVLDGSGRPIPNLYAAGNNAGSPFGNCYPGAGGTIGPALTFGFVAANDIAARAKAEEQASRLQATG
ncbi:MAG TPA: FAD-dependent oxidoreductase [Povalibacter sp.]|uniref:FAD-dependent oxidoreductase n=1 Tax=Povalibacter sp. TaxID=1962978 RepID=UPI002D0CB736|nr:FAD-dependent oxidoreductase [Povalibacter sp.]HMN43646.1 FAD-dependent oxidoreductase [Povalibacter sp.]